MSARAAPAFHGVGVITVVMRWASSSHTRVMDPTWLNGVADRRRSPIRLSTPAPAAMARRQPWSNTAPLGAPVVPLVHTMATGSSVAIAGRAVNAGSSAAAATSPGSSRVTTGSARSMIERTSDGPSRGLRPVVMAPTRIAP